MATSYDFGRVRRRGVRLLATVLLAAPLVAQAGDRKGEVQPPLPDDLVVPPAPVLSPEEALLAFDLEEGHRIHAWASEPLVEDPVWLSWDEDGRAWIVEMRGYMPDADGNGEQEPVGEIAVLEDTDGDFRADKRTTFLDGLVLPRAVHPCEGGALVIAPPKLSLWTDTDGDGRADHEEVIRDVGTVGLHNPEHAVNALTMTYEGTWQVANSGLEFWRGRREWEFRRTAGGGQWGLGFDARGRRYFNTNPDPLRGDLYPSRYAIRNGNHGRAKGVNVRWAHAMETWPSRINPGVNRGYQPATLRDDWTLARFTAACGPHVYEGKISWLAGSAFVCEPTGNLVKRYEIVEDGLEVRAEPTSTDTEFLRSTDERFRPVQAATGPDGALYLVDFYRGLIQHRVFLTTFLRRQAEARGLVAPTGLGRIWRIAPRYGELDGPDGLGDASWTELVRRLGHSNAWWRRTATRVLVEEARDDRVGLAVLRAGLVDENARVREGCVRVLHRLERLRDFEVMRALVDDEEAVRIGGLVAAEPFLRAADENVLGLVAARAPRATDRERLQLVLSLGEAHAGLGDEATLHALEESDGDRLFFDAAVSGLEGRELEFLERCLESARPDDARFRVLSMDLARAVVREGHSGRIDRLLAVVCGLPDEDPRQGQLARAILQARPPGPDGQPGWIRLAEPPTLLPPELREDLWAALAWPGRPDLPPEAEARRLEEDEVARFEHGRSIYATVCAACHQDHGRGEPGKAPALRHSPYVLGDEQRLVRIVSGGLVGPIDVLGEHFDAEMPSWGASDEDLAAVLTYLRRGWDHVAEPVTAGDVAAIRAADQDCATPWTVDSLEAN